MTSSEQLFVTGLDVFTSTLAAVAPDAWDRPSACAGWSNLDVVGHVGTTLDLGTQFLQGGQPAFPQADRPADLVEGEPVEWIEGLATRARAALAAADLDLEVDTPMGRRTVRDRLAFPAMDLYLHAWDIGHGLGIEVPLPDDLIEFSHQYIDPIPDEMVRGERGAFGPVVEVDGDASAVDRYLAWSGRDPR